MSYQTLVFQIVVLATNIDFWTHHLNILFKDPHRTSKYWMP